MAEYATVQQLRDEGVTLTQATDAQLLWKIQYASDQIDRWTGRWFVPKTRVFLIDGVGHPILQLDTPIIWIAEVRILSQGNLYLSPSDEVVDLSSVRVYNRHITMGLLNPDDRLNPKLEWLNSGGGYRGNYYRTPGIFPTGGWPCGVQNIQVSGIFGFTDPDDALLPYVPPVLPYVPPLDPVPIPLGHTPRLITRACLMLVVRDLLPVGNIDGRLEQDMATRLTSIRTRDQAMSWGARSSGTSTTSAYSGDVAIDKIISMYARQISLGAV